MYKVESIQSSILTTYIHSNTSNTWMSHLVDFLVLFVSDYEECETKPSDAITTNYVNIDNSTDIFGELHGDGDGPEHDHADDNFIHM